MPMQLPLSRTYPTHVRAGASLTRTGTRRARRVPDRARYGRPGSASWSCKRVISSCLRGRANRRPRRSRAPRALGGASGDSAVEALGDAGGFQAVVSRDDECTCVEAKARRVLRSTAPGARLAASGLGFTARWGLAHLPPNPGLSHHALVRLRPADAPHPAGPPKATSPTAAATGEHREHALPGSELPRSCLVRAALENSASTQHVSSPSAVAGGASAASPMKRTRWSQGSSSSP